MASRFCVCIAMAEDQLFSGESKNMNEHLNAILIIWLQMRGLFMCGRIYGNVHRKQKRFMVEMLKK